MDRGTRGRIRTLDLNDNKISVTIASNNIDKALGTTNIREPLLYGNRRKAGLEQLQLIQQSVADCLLAWLSHNAVVSCSMSRRSWIGRRPYMSRRFREW